MTERLLRTIEVEGFTSIRSATVHLGGLNVLVGANGAGKSNFIRVLEMLGRIADGELNLFVGFNGGSAALVNSSTSAIIRILLDAPPNSYEAILGMAANDELIFTEESISFRGQKTDEPWTSSLGRGHRETRLHDVRPDQERAAGYVRDMLAGCRVYHFHDTSVSAPAKRIVSTADNISLRQDAANLAAVLFALRRTNPNDYRRIEETIRQVAPFFRDFVLLPESPDRIRLRWRPVESDAVYSANQMSDGTLRFVCLATLLLHPVIPSVVVLDEPELGLHPYAIVQLAELLRQASVRSQVVIATQSVTLMNQFQIGDLIVVERSNGASVFTRPDPDSLQAWLKDYSLGELWEKNLIGGRPGDAVADG